MSARMLGLARPNCKAPVTRVRKRGFLGAVVAFSVVATSLALASAAGAVGISTDRPRYLEGERALIRLVNDSVASVTVEGPIEIVDVPSREVVARYLDSTSRTLAPGDAIEWLWDQWKGDCSDTCEHPEIDPPDVVGPGRYLVRVETEEGVISDNFSIGQYFTLGFRDRDEEFAVFSNDAHIIEQLEAEAAAEEKRLIVAGVVRRGRASYNSAWRFNLLPRSLVTGEVFIEVCDATPAEVEQHLRNWKGQQWCPWSSYVSSVGVAD